MAYDKFDQLFDALEADGVKTKGREHFKALVLAPGEEGYRNRLRLFEALKADGLTGNINTYEDFAQFMGLHAVKAQPQSAPKPAVSAPTSAPSSDAPLKVTDIRPTAMPGGSVRTPIPDFEASIARLRQATDNARRALARTHGKIGSGEGDGIVSDDTVSRINEDAGIIAASKLGVNGSRYSLNGIATQPSGNGGAETQQPDKEKASAGDQFGAVPYGMEVQDGELKPRWMLPSGESTSDSVVADQAEYDAKHARLKRQFDNRMKDKGLDPSKPIDVELQTVDERIAANEERLKALYAEKERRLQNQEADGDFVSMVGGAAYRSVTAGKPKADTSAPSGIEGWNQPTWRLRTCLPRTTCLPSPSAHWSRRGRSRSPTDGLTAHLT